MCEDVSCVSDRNLENDVALLEISISGSESSAGHLFDEDLAAQPEAVLYNETERNIGSVQHEPNNHDDLDPFKYTAISPAVSLVDH